MKLILLGMGLSLLLGCSSTMTLAELEAEALRTGDWSAVERRERAIARRRSSCPQGMTAVCESRGGGQRCECIESDVMREQMSRMLSW